MEKNLDRDQLNTVSGGIKKKRKIDFNNPATQNKLRSVIRGTESLGVGICPHCNHQANLYDPSSLGIISCSCICENCALYECKKNFRG